MASSPDAVSYFFQGDVDPVLTSSPDASGYIFQGNVVWGDQLVNPNDAIQYIFQGTIPIPVEGGHEADAYLFQQVPGEYPPLPTGSVGTTLYPISEDPTIRPPLRY